MKATLTFGIPASVIFDMGMKDGPVPPGVRSPGSGPLKPLDQTAWITCSTDEAIAMEKWLRDHANESSDFMPAAELIRKALHQASTARREGEEG